MVFAMQNSRYQIICSTYKLFWEPAPRPYEVLTRYLSERECLAGALHNCRDSQLALGPHAQLAPPGGSVRRPANLQCRLELAGPQPAVNSRGILPPADLGVQDENRPAAAENVSFDGRLPGFASKIAAASGGVAILMGHRLALSQSQHRISFATRIGNSSKQCSNGPRHRGAVTNRCPVRYKKRRS